MINLKNVVVQTKSVDVAYPGIPGFVVTIGYVSRATSRKIVESSKKDVMVNGAVISVQDDDLFVENFVKSAILGWKGLTLGDVSKLLLIDAQDLDLDTEVEFSIDNAVQLMKESVAFDNWINTVVFQLDSFR
ncbi:hypothetical protein My1_135 [Pectobacterium phage My1]|uniref:Uncharacterized protein n=1 Tax=Pectobacterium phage My1 TaxID=1204539 RepID=J9QL20_9CAUD|nr:hypothetical protein My1_135 [Pectobacterium phage My1]AFQ22294.1 hypothetical protein My1_135 [Pectobacterium phage My1]